LYAQQQHHNTTTKSHFYNLLLSIMIITLYIFIYLFLYNSVVPAAFFGSCDSSEPQICSYSTVISIRISTELIFFNEKGIDIFFERINLRNDLDLG